jgi:3-oxoacyl-[acyl-carrier-protein] synthase II
VKTRVVVTGLGAVSGFGASVPSLWLAALAGRSAVRPLALFDASTHRTRVAAAVAEADLPPAPPGHSRADRFAVAAAREAVAGIDPALLGTDRAGVFFGSSTGGLFEGERWFAGLLGRAAAELRTVASQENNGPGDAVARALRVRGPVLTASTACTSANVALTFAFDALATGEIDVAIAGGADELCEVTYAGFNALRAIDPVQTRPFRRSRAGLSLGEGSGVLLLETEAHARARGAPILAELLGGARSCDAYHVSAPDPGGAGAAAAIAFALQVAGLRPEDVTFVNAHGTGTPHNDDAEAAAMRAVFGDAAARLPITSTKSMTGHLLGAAGGIEAVLTVLSIVHRAVPPTHGDEPADEALGLDVVLGAPRALPAANVGVSTNLAFGGNNCAVVFGSYAAAGGRP